MDEIARHFNALVNAQAYGSVAAVAVGRAYGKYLDLRTARAEASQAPPY